MSFFEGLQIGLGAGGVVIGVLASVGGTLVLIGLIGLALIYAAGGFDRIRKEGKHERENNKPVR